MILGWELSCLLGPMRSGEVDIFLRPFPTAWLWCCGNQPVIFFIFFCEAKEDKFGQRKWKMTFVKLKCSNWDILNGYFWLYFKNWIFIERWSSLFSPQNLSKCCVKVITLLFIFNNIITGLINALIMALSSITSKEALYCKLDKIEVEGLFRFKILCDMWWKRIEN